MTDEALDAAEARIALARAALAEVTDPADVGDLIDVTSPAEGVADLRFACALGGYVGWAWTVSTAQIAGAEPTVLEVELLPMDGALLAPPWVPWTERLAEWRRAHPDDETDDDADEDDLGDDEVADGLDDDDLDEELGDAEDSDDDASDDDSDDDDSDEDASDDDSDEDDDDDADSDEDDDDLDDDERDEGLREV